MKKDVYLLHTALAPIIHQEPKTRNDRNNVTPQQGEARQSRNNVVWQRKDSVLVLEGGKFVHRCLPMVSGNSVRCANRREFVKRVLSKLGFVENGVVTGLRRELVETLLAGGKQQKGSGDAHPFVGAYVQTYTDLPFFGLFGGTYKQVFFGGRLFVGFAVPVADGVKRLLVLSRSPFAEVPGIKGDPKDLAAREVQYTRFRVGEISDEETDGEGGEVGRVLAAVSDSAVRDAILEDFADAPQDGRADLRRTREALHASESAQGELKELFGLRPGDDINKILQCLAKVRVTRALYSVAGAIPMGTALHQRISLIPGYGDDNLMEMTFDAYLETVIERGYLGGMLSKGYGAVHTEAKLEDGRSFSDHSRGGKFWEWLDKNKEALREKLKNFDSHLFATRSRRTQEQAQEQTQEQAQEQAQEQVQEQTQEQVQEQAQEQVQEQTQDGKRGRKRGKGSRVA